MLNFEQYLDLVKKQADEKLTGNKQKFFDVLKLQKDAAKIADKNVVTASAEVKILLPVKYKNEKFARVIAEFSDDYSLAMQDMEDPEKFAAILSILNDKLAKDGDVYDISTPETKILGLANRYANNARECQYARQWKLFAFYMRSLAYFIPQLIEKANMTEEKILNKLEAKLYSIKAEETCPVCKQDPCICDDYEDDVSPNGLTAEVIEAADPVKKFGKWNVAVVLPGKTSIGRPGVKNTYDEPLVEFYDSSSTAGGKYGQFTGGCYGINDICPRSSALELDRGAGWTVSSNDMKNISKWLEQYAKINASVIEAGSGRIVDRDGNGRQEIELKPGQWCWYFSTNNTKYSVHNAAGQLKAFKNGMNPTALLPDMKKRIKTVAAAREVPYQELVNDLDEKVRMVKNSLDKINSRFKYRMITNVSYPLKEANQIEEDIWQELNKIDKQVNKLWNKIG